MDELSESKKRLDKSITKKIQTTMIGALAAFEERFSFLWTGNTAEHMKMKSLWEDARAIILTNGNKQINTIKNELEVYTIEYNGYVIEIKMKEGK